MLPVSTHYTAVQLLALLLLVEVLARTGASKFIDRVYDSRIVIIFRKRWLFYERLWQIHVWGLIKLNILLWSESTHWDVFFGQKTFSDLQYFVDELFVVDFLNRCMVTNLEKSFPTNASISNWNSWKKFSLIRAGLVSSRYRHRSCDCIKISLHNSKMTKSASEAPECSIGVSAGPWIDLVNSPEVLKVTLIFYFIIFVSV